MMKVENQENRESLDSSCSIEIQRKHNHNKKQHTTDETKRREEETPAREETKKKSPDRCEITSNTINNTKQQ